MNLIYKVDVKMNETVELIGQSQRELGDKKDGRFSFEEKTSDIQEVILLISKRFSQSHQSHLKNYNLKCFAQNASVLIG